ncbi:MAG: nucleotidyltransferase family protein [bacterium]|nr:nucleotidyltransferase family protein [bacterium]
MDAVILAAGLGTRLRPLTLERPKPMLIIAGKPIIEHSIKMLPPQIDRVVLVVNYLAEQIEQHVGQSFAGRSITYVHQEELGGSGAALSAAQYALRPGQKFLVLMGDDLYSGEDLQEMVRHTNAILVKEVAGPGRFGTVELDATGMVSAIREAGDGSPLPPYLINCGAYTLDHQYFLLPARLTPKREVGLPQTMTQLAHLSASKGGPKRITAVRAKEWNSIGTPEEFALVKALPRFSEHAPKSIRP